MGKEKRKLTQEEIKQAFEDPVGKDFPIILNPEKLAHLLGLSRKTIYEWISQGRLDDVFRKRGKHVLIWRDRALDLLFNGPDWSNTDE